MNPLVFAVLIMAIVVVCIVAYVSWEAKTIARMKKNGEQVPEERKVYSVIDWTRR